MSLINTKPVVGLDIEVQPEPHIWCVGLADGEKRTATRDWETLPLQDITPVGHNMKYDVAHLETAGTRIDDWHDTIIEAHLLGYKPLNLPTLSGIFNGEQLDKSFVKNRNKIPFDDIPDDTLQGCSKDAWASWALHHQWYPELEQRGLVPLYEKEKRVTRVLMDMERRGLPLDQSRVKTAVRRLIQLMGKCEKTLAKHGIAEPNDMELVGQKFWRHKGRVQTTKNGKLSTAKANLEKYRTDDEVEWTDAFIEWQSLSKLKSTYLSKYEGIDLVHGSFNQTGTISWRFSSSDPNLQNVPKSKVVPLYQLFVAPEGFIFISADYSQLELRHLGNISGDDNMAKAYERGADLHQDALENTPMLVKMAVSGDPFMLDKARRWAKVRNFGIAFGITEIGLAPKMEVEVEVAKEFIDDWYARYPAVKPWQEASVRYAEDHGYVLGEGDRPLYVPGIMMERGRLRGHAEKQCLNLPVQGGAADIVKDAMLRCNQYLVCQVHDELLYLVPIAEAEEFKAHLYEVLADYRYRIPYTVDVKMGSTWGEIKNIPDVMFDDFEEIA